MPGAKMAGSSIWTPSALVTAEQKDAHSHDTTGHWHAVIYGNKRNAWSPYSKNSESSTEASPLLLEPGYRKMMAMSQKNASVDTLSTG
jgi:hypothetical protein